MQPGIIHLGLGGFHRAHMARYVHDLMERVPDVNDWGIIGVGLRKSDRSLIEALARQDCLYTLVERDGDGEKSTVIGSIVRVIDASCDTGPVLDACCDPAIRILSLTITEHGYCLNRATKRLDPDHPDIAHDVRDPEHPHSAIGLIAQALAIRRRAGLPGLTVLSCDNIQHNGDVLRQAVLDFAALRDDEQSAWLARNASFPNSMVDRITPQPAAAAIQAFREATRTEDGAPLICEPFRQWVIEDRFTVGRPPLEHVGVQFVDDVEPFERMKLRLLNASHLALSGPGELAGFVSVAETIAAPAVERYVRMLMERETGPTLRPVPGVDIIAYKHSVIERFANPTIPDTVARINADAPLNYLLDPIRDRLAANAPFDLLALALGTWLRRVAGMDENGDAITVVHPLAEELRERALAGGPDPRPVLGMRSVFGDLASSTELVSVTEKWLQRIYNSGSMETLRALSWRT
jgi:mannitol-1-phosphate/altronate dehydrogenase